MTYWAPACAGVRKKWALGRTQPICPTPFVIASGAKQPRAVYAALDCFVASLLAMTIWDD